MIVDTPPSPPTEEELQAIIEEARRRARKRRLGYLAFAAGAAIAGGGLYLLIGNGGIGGGGGDGGSSLQPQPSDGPVSGESRPQNEVRPFVRSPRCPGRGESALPPDFGLAWAAARAVVNRRVGTSPQIDATITLADGAIDRLCGREIARRTLLVETYDHRFDHGPNRSASLAQHRFYVSRFDDGYHAWYWAH